METINSDFPSQQEKKKKKNQSTNLQWLGSRNSSDTQKKSIIRESDESVWNFTRRHIPKTQIPSNLTVLALKPLPSIPIFVFSTPSLISCFQCSICDNPRENQCWGAREKLSSHWMRLFDWCKFLFWFWWIKFWWAFFRGGEWDWWRCEMNTQRQQVMVRDLVEEAKKRIVVLAICVVGLSYLMSCKFFDYFPFNFVIWFYLSGAIGYFGRIFFFFFGRSLSCFQESFISVVMSIGSFGWIFGYWFLNVWRWLAIWFHVGQQNIGVF